MDFFTPKNTVPLKSGVLLVGIAPKTRGKVAFIAESGPDGAVAFSLTDPSKHNLSELVPELVTANDIPVAFGGKTQRDTLHMLHKCDYGGTTTGPVQWGGSYESLKERVRNGTANPASIRLFVGYAGWDSGELEKEIKDGLWACVEASEQVIMSGKNPWKYLVKKLGPFGQLVLNTPISLDKRIPAAQLN